MSFVRFGLVLIALASLGAAAHAQDDETGKRPEADAPAAAQQDCVADTSSFRKNGNEASFTIELTNSCEKRIKCKVEVYILTSRGPASGDTVLYLGRKSEGAEARQIYALPTKQAAGMANLSRECDEY